MRIISRIGLRIKGSMGARATQAFKIPKEYSGRFSKALKDAIGQHIERIKTDPAPKSKEGHESKFMLVSMTVYVHRVELLKKTAKRIFADLERIEKKRIEEEERKQAEAKAKLAEKRKKKKEKISKKKQMNLGKRAGVRFNQ